MGAYVISKGVIALEAIDAESLLRGVRIDLGVDWAMSLAHVCSHLKLTRLDHVPLLLHVPGEAISHADMVMVSFEPTECQIRVNATTNWPLGNHGLSHVLQHLLDTSVLLLVRGKCFLICASVAVGGKRSKSSIV